MRKKTSGIRSMVLLLLGGLLLAASPAARAEAWKGPPDSIRTWSNGIRLTAGMDGTDGIRITASTKGLERGYYSASVYESLPQDWSAYGGMGWTIVHESSDPVQLNLTATLSGGDSLAVPAGNAVMLQREGSDRIELVYAGSGGFELEGGFRGAVTIPFASVGSLSGGNTVHERELADITAWGLALTMEANREVTLQAGGVRWIPKDRAAFENQLAGLKVTADSRMLKPAVGVSIMPIRVEGGGEDMQPELRLEPPVPGASLADGVLTLEPGIQADQLTVAAVWKDKWFKPLSIDLAKSWTADAKEADGTSLAIQAPDQIPPVIRDSDPLAGAELKMLLRSAGWGGLGVVLLLYAGWRRACRAQRKEAGDANG